MFIYWSDFMLLTIDIGNSYISSGCFDGERLVFVSDIVTDIKKSSDQYAVEMLQINKLYNVLPKDITGAIICSVVPELTETIKNAVNKICGVDALIVGPGVKSGLKISIDNPAQLGADTVATAVGALERFRTPIVICDFGTATVFGVIDNSQSFAGMIISAGVGTTLDALTKRTALLPQVSITKPKKLVGTNTVESIQSGLINGTAAMVDGIVNRLKNEYGEELTVVATGKYAKKIIPMCTEKAQIFEHLVFYGLKSIYEKNTLNKKGQI